MTDTNKMRDPVREKFEAWANARYSWHLFEDTRGECDKTLTSWDGQAYGNRIVEGMWQAWQASRQAVVVALPPMPPAPEDPEEAIDDSHMDAYHAAVRMRAACAESVEAAGLRYEVRP